MKEKLILPFFWLAVIVTGLWFFEAALDAIALGILANIVNFFEFFVRIILALVSIRLLSELAVATFRINDNLSPDGGKSETANIDPMEEARKVAEMAADRAREAAKTAGEKTQAATKTARDSISGKPRKSSDTSDKAQASDQPSPIDRPKAAPSRDTAPKNPVKASKRATPKAASPKPASSNHSKGKAVKTTAKTSTAKTSTVKTSTVKTSAKAKPITKQTDAPKKRGPKPGVKMRRDAQGRLLKKDGTLRGKPGPKKP